MTFVAMFRDGVLVVVPDPYAVIMHDYVKRTVGDSVWFTEIVTDRYAHAHNPTQAVGRLRERTEQRLGLIRQELLQVEKELTLLNDGNGRTSKPDEDFYTAMGIWVAR